MSRTRDVQAPVFASASSGEEDFPQFQREDMARSLRLITEGNIRAQ